ncbi:MAG TPA: ABC transporter permease [Candidatus Acidoferrum sp.]|jgi:rhamnose transport system permease protein|nr:ABC transporter permease [Candidatus Acidoferrum sp.]
MKRYSQEISVAIAIAVLAAVLAFAAPSYFSHENLADLFLSNMPVLVVAIGMTLVVLTAEIDVSVGSIFAICGVAAGVIAKAGAPMLVVCLGACAIGAALGALNGALVAYVRIPSIVVTLATMTALRDGLRWATQGAWIADLPPSFQWFGLAQSTYPIAALATAVALVGATAWGLRHLAAGRAIYATGSNAEAARVAGIHTHRLVFLVFLFTGALTGFAAVFNSVRFNQIPSNAGLGLELKVIAAVVVGGTAITGGRGSIAGTVLGVILLGAIGPALTFLGTSAYWEQALQGVVIIAAIVIEALRSRAERRAAGLAAHRV